MIRNHLTLVFILAGIQAFAQQDPVAIKYAQTITAEDLKGNLSIIASDAMEGRETGKRGQKMAAAFISYTFQDLGLAAPVNGSYYQPVPLYSAGISGVTLSTTHAQLDKSEFAYAGRVERGGLVEMPMVWAGKGTTEEIANIDLAGKAVMLNAEAARNMFANPLLTSLQEKGAKSFFIVLDKEDDFARITNQIKYFSEGRLSLLKPVPQNTVPGVFYLTWNSAAKMFNTTPDNLQKTMDGKKIAKVKPTIVSYNILQFVKEIESENVLGFLEGTDKKDEVVVITAHYDHIGISSREEGDKINNGADDDGSGTVAVLALAKAFAQAKKDGKGQRRSILFMAVTGEEKGLLGSEYYVGNPMYALNNTVVNLNVDMIGRSDPQHKGSAPYVYLIGSDKLSSELHTLSEITNKTYTHLIFDYTYNDQNHPDRLYYRSDHWNFAQKNIPIIFYFDGIHEDYHKPGDEVDKIDFDLLTVRTKTVFHTAWEIANRENRLTVDKK